MASKFDKQWEKYQAQKKTETKKDGIETAEESLSRTTTGRKRKYVKRVPHENKNIVMHVRLTADEYTAINELAQRRNISVSQLAREELNNAVTRLKSADRLYKK